jgi:hypothetical protein
MASSADDQPDLLAHPTVTTETFSLTFRHLAEGIGAGRDKRVLSMLDRAG